MTPGTALAALPWGRRLTALLLLVAVFIICVKAVPRGCCRGRDPLRPGAVRVHGERQLCLTELSGLNSKSRQGVGRQREAEKGEMRYLCIQGKNFISIIKKKKSSQTNTKKP